MAQNIFKEIEKGNLAGLKRCISLYSTCTTAKNPVSGATPLHLAAAAGLPAFVRELLLHGAPHDVMDNSGNVPLHLAAEQGSVESVVELLTGPGRKLMVKQKNRDGQTPLHLAVRNSHIEVVAKLIDAGARTDAKDRAGNTPLELVDGQNEGMLELLLAVPTSSGPAGGGGGGNTPLNASATIRASTDTPLSAYRNAPGGGTTPAPRGVAGTPSSARPTSAVGAGARTPLAGSGTPGAGARSALPRTSVHVGAGQLTPGAGAGAAGSGTGAPTTGPTMAMQLQKHDHAIQELQSDMRAATERLGAVDATAHAQIESAAQLERALELTGKHNRALSELEERVGFAEERGKDTRGRLERLEDGERSLQETAGRLSSDQRGLGAQLRELSEQVVLLSSSAARTVASDSSATSHATQALHTELASLRAQMDQLAPALAVATAASAEARAVSSRLDAVQQQQHAAGGSIVLEQQVVQLQAQVQLLQLPVATLTQQCAELSSKLAGLSEWQHQAQAELARLAAAPARTSEAPSGEGLSVLGTTSAALAELKQQQDATARQVAALLQMQAGLQASPGSPGPGTPTPAVPSTPNGGAGRSSLGGTGTPLGGLGSYTPQQPGDLRAEVEALRALLGDLKKDMATEGGSIRREWQRAFSDMQSRYGEQANELRAREQNIAKLREAALVEEAERRAQASYEDKYLKRLTKLETGMEYMTHRMEVLEEQLSGLSATVNGGLSPSAAVSPSRAHGPGAAAAAGARSTPRSGAGPVSEHSFATPVSQVTSAAAASLLSSLAATPLAGVSKAQPATRVAVDLAALGAAQPSGIVNKEAAPATGGLLWKGALFAVSSPSKAGAGGRTLVQQPLPEPQQGQQVGCSGNDGGQEPWWRPAHEQQEQGATWPPHPLQQHPPTAYGQCRLGVVAPALAMAAAASAAGPSQQAASAGQWHGAQLVQQQPCAAMRDHQGQQHDGASALSPGAADPASVAAASPQLQMLPAHAQSVLAPSMDIQRLAAAAHLQQQLQQLQQLQLQHQQKGGMHTAAGTAGAEAGSAPAPAAAGSGQCDGIKARPREPPACLN